MLSQESGLIRIPISKQETGYKSQLHASNLTSMTAELDGIPVLENSVTTEASSFERTDNKVQVTVPLVNSQNLSYIGELYIGSGEQP